MQPSPSAEDRFLVLFVRSEDRPRRAAMGRPDAFGKRSANGRFLRIPALPGTQRERLLRVELTCSRFGFGSKRFAMAGSRITKLSLFCGSSHEVRRIGPRSLAVDCIRFERHEIARALRRHRDTSRAGLSPITLLAGSVQQMCQTRRSDIPPWAPSECNPV